MTDIVVLSVLRILGAILAFTLVVLAVRAWRGSKDRRMMRLALGFGLVFLAILVEGLSFQVLLPGDLMSAHLIEAGVQVAAMAVFIWALF